MAGMERLYSVWSNMRNRCNNSRCKDYRYYGGKGVTVCQEWNDYYKFRKWAYDNGYQPNCGLTIERNDVCGNYCPENCSWVTRKEQCNNMTSNKLLTLNGETHNIAVWSEKTGIPYTVLESRVTGYGWSDERALTTPVNAHRKQYEFNGVWGDLKELSRRFGINYHTLYNRINSYHWDIDRALTEKVGERPE